MKKSGIPQATVDAWLQLEIDTVGAVHREACDHLEKLRNEIRQLEVVEATQVRAIEKLDAKAKRELAASAREADQTGRQLAELRSSLDKLRRDIGTFKQSAVRLEANLNDRRAWQSGILARAIVAETLIFRVQVDEFLMTIAAHVDRFRRFIDSVTNPANSHGVLFSASKKAWAAVTGRRWVRRVLQLETLESAAQKASVLQTETRRYSRKIYSIYQSLDRALDKMQQQTQSGTPPTPEASKDADDLDTDPLFLFRELNGAVAHSAQWWTMVLGAEKRRCDLLFGDLCRAERTLACLETEAGAWLSVLFIQRLTTKLDKDLQVFEKRRRKISVSVGSRPLPVEKPSATDISVLADMAVDLMNQLSYLRNNILVLQVEHGFKPKSSLDPT